MLSSAPYLRANSPHPQSTHSVLPNFPPLITIDVFILMPLAPPCNYSLAHKFMHIPTFHCSLSPGSYRISSFFSCSQTHSGPQSGAISTLPTFSAGCTPSLSPPCCMDPLASFTPLTFVRHLSMPSPGHRHTVSLPAFEEPGPDCASHLSFETPK